MNECIYIYISYFLLYIYIYFILCLYVMFESLVHVIRTSGSYYSNTQTMLFEVLTLAWPRSAAGGAVSPVRIAHRTCLLPDGSFRINRSMIN